MAIQLEHLDDHESQRSLVLAPLCLRCVKRAGLSGAARTKVKKRERYEKKLAGAISPSTGKKARWSLESVLLAAGLAPDLDYTVPEKMTDYNGDGMTTSWEFMRDLVGLLATGVANLHRDLETGKLQHREWITRGDRTANLARVLYAVGKMAR